MTAVRTISGVNASTDTLTVTAHGLNTGDGFLRVYTPNGAIPGGLAAVTDYWAIKTGTDTLKLATSSSNALAGTAIDITSTGSGTLELLQGLPYAVPRVAAPGGQVASADFNDTWSSLVALWNFVTGQAQSIFSGIVLAANQDIVLSGTGRYKRGTLTRRVSPSSGILIGGAVHVLPGEILLSGSGNKLYGGITLEDGETLTAVRVQVDTSGTGSVDFKVYKAEASIGPVQLGTTQTSSGSTAQVLAVSGLTLASSANLSVAFVVDWISGSTDVYAIEYDTIIP